MLKAISFISINLKSTEEQTIAYRYALENNEEVVNFLLEFVRRHRPENRLKLLQELIRGYLAADNLGKAKAIAELGSNSSDLSLTWFNTLRGLIISWHKS